MSYLSNFIQITVLCLSFIVVIIRNRTPGNLLSLFYRRKDFLLKARKGIWSQGLIQIRPTR